MENSLIVGQIVKPQGIRGEVKVVPFTDGAEDFHAFKRVFLDGEEYKVLSVRVSDGMVYLGLRGVPDRNAAELLRGKKVNVLREDAPEPEEGRYYIVDILQSEIVTETGEVLGVLKDVRQAATDVYTAEINGKEVLIPAADGVILSVDINNKKLTVNKKRFYEVAVL